jgi:hypothetical protein
MTAVSPVVKPVSQMRLAPGSTVNIQDISLRCTHKSLRVASQRLDPP